MNDYNLSQRRPNDHRENILSSDLSVLSTFIEFANSDLAEKRLLAAQRSSNPLQKIECAEEMSRYLDVLESFFSHEDEAPALWLDSLKDLWHVYVRLAILEQVTGVFLELKKKNHSCFEKANKCLSPHVANALSLTIEAQVNAVDAITNLIDSNSISQEVITDVFIPSLFTYVREAVVYGDKRSAIYRTNISNATTILCQVTSTLGRYPPRWLFHRFLPDFSALLLDRDDGVRKLALSTIGALARHFGAKFAERCAVPHLVAASRDTDQWIRKACCDVFVDVASSVSMTVRQRTLTPLFLRFLNDVESVHGAAIRQIGPFIATFADSDRQRAEVYEGRLKSADIVDGGGGSILAGGRIRSFSSTDDLTSLRQLDENGRLGRGQDDEGIAEEENALNYSSDDPTPLADGEEQAGFTIAELYDGVPSGFLLPNNDESTTAIVQSHIVATVHDTIAPKNYEAAKASSRIRASDDDGDSGPSAADDLNVEAADRLSALACSLTFWSFGNPSPVSDADVDEYLSRSLRRARRSNRAAVGAADMDEPVPVRRSDDENGDDVRGMNDAELWILPKVTAPPPPRSAADAKPTAVSANSGSNYWQRRLDLLHKSVQTIVQNGNTALAAAALLPSSLKRLSLNSLNAGGSLNSAVDNGTPLSPATAATGGGATISKSKRKAEKSTEKVKMVKSTTPTTVSATTTKTANSTDANSNEQTPRSRRQPPAANAPEPSFDWLRLRILDAEDEMNAEERGSYGTGRAIAGGASPGTKPAFVFEAANLLRNGFPASQIAQCHFFTDDEFKQLCAGSTQDIVPQELLERLNMELLNRSHSEMNWHIAHSMPAIVYTLGRKNWIHIKGLYLYLTDHYHMEVRKSLANSLHEVAAIVGTAVSDRDLLPVFLKFLEDTMEVRYGLLRNLYHFCKVLSFTCRRQLAQKLNLFVTVNSANSSYRIRAEFAEQLVFLVRLFEAEEVNKFVCAYALTFATDRIAEVRANGIKILAEVLTLFIREEWARFVDKFLDGGGHVPASAVTAVADSSPPSGGSIVLPLTDSLLHDVRVGFWRTRNWRRRQSFGRMLDFILRKGLITEDQFFYIFYDDFMHVSEDEVANVRQYFCSMCQLTRTSGFFRADRSVSISVRNRLKGMIEEDPDLEIRHQAMIALGDLDPATAEIDLGQRGVQLQAATESIYDRHLNRPWLFSDRQPFVEPEPAVPVSSMFTYTSHSSNGAIMSSVATYSMSGGSPSLADASVSCFTGSTGSAGPTIGPRVTGRFQYFPNQMMARPHPRVPPLALTDDEDVDDETMAQDCRIYRGDDESPAGSDSPQTGSQSQENFDNEDPKTFGDTEDLERSDGAAVREVLKALLIATVYNELNNVRAHFVVTTLHSTMYDSRSTKSTGRDDISQIMYS